MAGKKTFQSKRAPVPVGPYSQAVIHKGLLYISGQLPIDPHLGTVKRSTIEEEASVVLNNIRMIVEDAGASLKDVLKVTCYLSDMNDFKGFNRVYGTFFMDEPPARTTLQAGKLPFDARIELDAIVALHSD